MLNEAGAVIAQCKLLAPNAKLPTRAKRTDAGWDLYTPHDILIPPHGIAEVKSGIALTVPEGYYYTIEGRSRFWKFNVMPHTGIIDATYSGELLVTMSNNSPEEVDIKAGDRFAQIVIQRIVDVEIVEVNEITYTGRGSDGFGSTGS